MMAGPDDAAVNRLRHIVQRLGLTWPTEVSLDASLRTCDPNDPIDAAFMLAIPRAGNGASHAPSGEGDVPWHARRSMIPCLRRDDGFLRDLLASQLFMPPTAQRSEPHGGTFTGRRVMFASSIRATSMSLRNAASA